MQESGELHKLERSSFSSFSKQHEWPIGKQKACWDQCSWTQMPFVSSSVENTLFEPTTRLRHTGDLEWLPAIALWNWRSRGKSVRSAMQRNRETHRSRPSRIR